MSTKKVSCGSRNYALESPREFDRLEKQSSFQGYSFDEDLADLPDLAESEHVASVLDAGCGSGQGTQILSRLYPTHQVTGCDRSEIRVEQARRKYAQDRIEFRVSNLLNDPPADYLTHQGIFSRFVLQHIEQCLQLDFIQGLYNRLTPGGWMRVVDCDGLLINLSPFPPDLMSATQKLTSQIGVDFMAGRKIPSLFRSVGLTQITCKVVPLVFFGAKMNQEIELMKERFQLTLPRMIEVLGSLQNAQDYQDRYLEGMASPGSIVVYNKFIVTGIK